MFSTGCFGVTSGWRGAKYGYRVPVIHTMAYRDDGFISDYPRNFEGVVFDVNLEKMI